MQKKEGKTHLNSSAEVRRKKKRGRGKGERLEEREKEKKSFATTTFEVVVVVVFFFFIFFSSLAFPFAFFKCSDQTCSIEARDSHSAPSASLIAAARLRTGTSEPLRRPRDPAASRGRRYVGEDESKTFFVPASSKSFF